MDAQVRGATGSVADTRHTTAATVVANLPRAMFCAADQGCGYRRPTPLIRLGPHAIQFLAQLEANETTNLYLLAKFGNVFAY